MSTFVKGTRIKSLDELVVQDFVFHVHGPKQTLVPFGWFQNWQLHYALVQIATNRLYHSKRKEARHA